MKTLNQMLATQAGRHKTQTFLVHQGQSFSYAEMLHRAQLSAHALKQGGAVQEGSNVLLMLDNGPAFFAAFFGTLMAGGVPVPIGPKSSKDRIAYIAGDCSAPAVIVDREVKPPVADLNIDVSILDVEEITRDRGATPGEIDPGSFPHPDSPAFIQYTSGSTGNSKGVVISHRAVLENIKAFSRRMGVSDNGAVFSSMMPLYHDMGLIALGLAPLFLGAKLVLYRQEALSLYHWLAGINEHGVTITGAPNTLLHLATKVVSEPGDYNLDSLRMLICGSEPIHKGVLEQFETLFQARGKIKPAYGLAEIALCATITDVDAPYRVDPEGVVSCGTAIEDVQVSIRDDDGTPVEQPGEKGEIWIQSPALMSGYYGRETATAEAVKDGYLLTGDLGYLDPDGRLYIVGRKKNMIVRGGEKFSPHDVEEIALGCKPVRAAAVVSCDMARTGNPSVVMVLEISSKDAKDVGMLQQLSCTICKEAQEKAHYQPDIVMITSPRNIPVTPNGKLQHEAMRQQIAGNTFPHTHCWQTGELPALTENTGANNAVA